MDENHDCICDRCGRTLPLVDLMEDEVCGFRPVCLDCYNEEYVGKAIVQGSIDAAQACLPSIEAFYQSLHRLPATPDNILAAFEGKCYAVAIQLQQFLAKHKAPMDVRRVHGFWLGADHRPDRRSFNFQQHGWLVCRPHKIKHGFCPDDVIVDPTQFVFSGQPPEILVTHGESHLYDEGGEKVRRHMGLGTVPKRVGRGKFQLAWTPRLKAMAQNYFPKRSLRKITFEEAHFLAHLTAETLGSLGPDMHGMLIKAKLGALIPIETRERVSGYTARPIQKLEVCELA